MASSYETLQKNARRLAADMARETPEAIVQEVGSKVAPPPVVDEKKEQKIQMKRLNPQNNRHGVKPVHENVRWQPHENVQPRQPAGKSVYQYEENSHNNSVTLSMCVNIARLLETNSKYQEKTNHMGVIAPPGFNGARKEMVKELQEYSKYNIKMQEQYGNTVNSGDVVEAIWELSESEFIVTQYGVSWRETLHLVWNRIRSIKKEKMRNGLKEMLAEAILQSKDEHETPCMSGKINRLVMVLIGTFDDMKLSLSESEVIQGIIVMVRDKFPNYLTDDDAAKLMYKELRKRLDERGIDKDTQKEWIKHLWPEDDDEDDEDEGEPGPSRRRRHHEPEPEPEPEPRRRRRHHDEPEFQPEPSYRRRDRRREVNGHPEVPARLAESSRRLRTKR